jgi:hypothetical protein
MSLKQNARSKAIENVLNSTVKTVNRGVKTITTPVVDTLDSMKKSLRNTLESNSSKQKNPIFDGVVPSNKIGGKRKSKKRKSRKHRKTAKK